MFKNLTYAAVVAAISWVVLSGCLDKDEVPLNPNTGDPAIVTIHTPADMSTYQVAAGEFAIPDTVHISATVSGVDEDDEVVSVVVSITDFQNDVVFNESSTTGTARTKTYDGSFVTTVPGEYDIVVYHGANNRYADTVTVIYQ